MKASRLLMASFALTAGVLSVQAETWYFRPNTKATYGYSVRTVANWTNAQGQVATELPGENDTVYINYATSEQPTSDNTTPTPWKEVFWENSSYCNQFYLCVWTDDTTAGNGGTHVRLKTNPFWYASGFLFYGKGSFQFDNPNNIEISFGKDIENRATRVWNSSTGDGTFVKDGSWTFTCFRYYGASTFNRAYKVKHTDLREGKFSIATTYVNDFPIDFHFKGPKTSRLEIGNSYATTTDYTMKNGALLEDAEAINSDHGVISSYGRTLAFTGTPQVSPMVFTGRFMGNVNLKWSPDSADSTFVFSNAVSTTTGNLTVDKGVVRFANGACWPCMGTATLGANATIEFADAKSAKAFKCGAAILDAAAKVKLPVGVGVRVSSLTIGGMPIPAGRYTSSDSSCIEGGYVIVGEVPSPTAVSATWNGSGDVTTLANWTGAETLPNLTDGSLVATVMSGASMRFPSDAWVQGLDLHASPFTIAAADGVTVGLGKAGLTGDPSGRGTNTVTASLQIRQDQTWKLGPSETLDLAAPITSFAGTYYAVTGGTVNATVSGSLGSYGGLAKFTYGTQLNLAGGTTQDADIAIYNPITDPSHSQYYYFDDNLMKPVVFKAGGETVLNGLFANTNGNLKVKFEKDAQVTMKGGWLSRNTLYIDAQSGARLRIEGEPLLNRNAFYTYWSSSSDFVIELAAEGNCMGYCNPYSGYNSKGTVKTLVPYALKDKTIYNVFESKGSVYDSSTIGCYELSYGAKLDLCGNDQSLCALMTKQGGHIASSAGLATLYLNATLNWGTKDEARYDNASWEGGASLCFTGKDDEWAHFFVQESSTTGRLEVVRGRVVMTAPGTGTFLLAEGKANTGARTATGGRWRQASEVVVKGGKLVVEHRLAFGNRVKVSYVKTGDAYGKIQLDAGVNMRAAELWIDGVKQPEGRYGSSSSVQAEGDKKNDALFAGTGCLTVGVPGMAIIFK